MASCGYKTIGIEAAFAVGMTANRKAVGDRECLLLAASGRLGQLSLSTLSGQSMIGYLWPPQVQLAQE